ncbi:MAG: LysM peptidoglycan-binding domain-containing protein [Candidatus Omnitrophica bacterium]|nr:LysM peptidoglycan-binding domain-containing protein [Candidatus Omnitrophota bacterium]
MFKKVLALAVMVSFAVGLTGCTVRTYKVTKDRVDQDLSAGNKGYLKGTPPSESGERKLTRDTEVVEVELGFPATGKKAKKPVKKGCAAPETPVVEESAAAPVEQPVVQMQQYKVEKGDTLQKISQKFYGTTKKWHKIFKANEGVLKGPNKIYPGQTINVPVEKMKAPVENLK